MPAISSGRRTTLRVAAVALLAAACSLAGGGYAAAAPAPAPGEAAGITADPFGNLSVFYQDAGTHHLMQTGRFTAEPWWEPLDLGGLVTSGAAGLTNQTTDSYAWVFVRGGNGSVYYRQRYTGGAGWFPWRSAGGAVVGTPSASCLGDQTTPPIVWARGTDDALYRQVLPGRWQRLGGVLASPPSAVPATMGTCPPHDDVFLLGANSAVYEWDGRAFHPVGGRSTVAPAAVRLPGGATWLFARGTDGALWLTVRVTDAAAWSAWRRLGGVLDGPPAATVFEDRATVVVPYAGGGLREGHFAGGTWVWSVVG